MADAFIVDAVRTPRGVGKVGKGALAHMHPQHLAATVLSQLAERNKLNTETVDDIIWGTSSQRGAQDIRTSENDWRISRTELRDDRAVFFLDYVPHGRTYQIQYLARCTLAGQAIAPPAKIEAMYHPTTFALSASRAFEATPEP